MNELNGSLNLLFYFNFENPINRLIEFDTSVQNIIVTPGVI